MQMSRYMKHGRGLEIIQLSCCIILLRNRGLMRGRCAQKRLPHPSGRVCPRPNTPGRKRMITSFIILYYVRGWALDGVEKGSRPDRPGIW